MQVIHIETGMYTCLSMNYMHSGVKECMTIIMTKKIYILVRPLLCYKKKEKHKFTHLLFIYCKFVVYISENDVDFYTLKFIYFKCASW